MENLTKLKESNKEEEEIQQTKEEEKIISKDEMTAGGSRTLLGQSSTSKPHIGKDLSGSARKRYKALISLGVELSEAAKLALKTFAELKQLGYKFGPPESDTKILAKVESPKGNTTKVPKVCETSKTSTTITNRETVRSIRVGIKDIKPMNDTQLETLRKCIIDCILDSEVGKGPKFQGCSMKPGWLLITCEDLHSKAWVEEKVPTLKPWPQTKLSILQECDLPKLNIGVVFIPRWEVGNTSEILKVIASQNKGLKTKLWKILNTRTDKRGLTMTVSIDSKSFKALKKMGLKVKIGMKKVKFRMKGNSRAKSTNKMLPKPLQASAISEVGPSAKTSDQTKIIHTLIPTASTSSCKSRGARRTTGGANTSRVKSTK